MANADGSVIISVGMDIGKADKELGKLKENIEKTEKEISDTRQKRDEARLKNNEAAAVLDEERDKLLEIQRVLSEIKEAAKDSSLIPSAREELKQQIPELQEELAEQKTRVKGLESDWNKAENAVDRYDQKIANLEGKLEQQKASAGELQQKINEEEQRRSEIAQNATVSDQHIIDLNRELLKLKEQQAALEQAGVGIGFQEYDTNAARIAEITQELKEYQKSINDTQKNAAASERLREIAAAAEAADQHIIDLNRELQELKERQKELESAGVGLGFQEYDENASRIAEITRELKEYRKALNGEESGEGQGRPEKPLDRAAQAAKRLNSILDKTASAFKTVGAVISAIEKAGGSMLSGARKALEFGKNLNALSKLTDAVGKKFKYFSRMLKRTFMTFTILKGLRAIRQQITSYLSVNAQLSASLRTLKGVFLTAFQPVYDIVVPALITMVNVITRAVAAISQFTAVLFGTTAKKAQENAKALYEQSNALKATGGAAEDAAKSFASFDEIDQLQDNKTSGGGGASTELGPTFDYEYENTVFDSWGEAFSAFLDKMLAGIPKLEKAFKNFADWLNGLSKKLYDMFTFPGVLEKVEQLGRDLANAFNKLTNWIKWEQLDKALGAGLNLALQFLTEFIYTYDWINLGKKLAEFINGLASEVDWYDFGRLLWAGFKISLETLAGFLLGLNMPELAKAASDLIKGFFDSMRETIEKIDWRAIGEQIRTFLVNVDWPGIADSVFGAIKAAFTASSDFFSGLLGEELKRQLTDMLITISKFTLVIGALLALSGANVPLGLGLMVVGAATLASAAALDWEYVLSNIKRIVSDIAAALGVSLLVLGAILTLSGTNIPLGIGLMAAGALSLATAAAINWDFIPKTISGIVTTALAILSVAFLVIGAILTFSGPSHIPLGIGLIALGAVSLAAALAINWDILPNTLSGIVSKITAILSVAFLALGAVLLFTNANIPLGLGLIAVGAVGLAATIAANWETIQPEIEGVLLALKIAAEAATLALGVVLLFSGAGIPLGLGLIGLGAAGLAATIIPNWDEIKEKLVGVWQGIKNWWKGDVDEYTKKKHWEGVGRNVADGLMNGLDTVHTKLNRWSSEVTDTINRTISNMDAKMKNVSYNSSMNVYPRMARSSYPDVSNFQIPALAKGAVIPPNHEFAAILGDQRSGTNIETPLSTMVQAFRQALNEGGYANGNRDITVILQMDKREFARAVYTANNDETQRVGVRFARGTV